MIITNQILRILRYIYKKKEVSYLSIRKKFKVPSYEILESLVYHQYLIQIGGSRTNTGNLLKSLKLLCFS